MILPAAGDAADRRDLDAEFRARARGLRAALGAPADDDTTRALAAHRRRVAEAAAPIDPPARARVAPALLHLGAVRLAGPDRELEARAYLFWERTLEGLLRSPPATVAAPPTPTPTTTPTPTD
jgi:hypothetical protein